MYGSGYELGELPLGGYENLVAARHAASMVIRDGRREMRDLRGQPMLDEVRMTEVRSLVADARVESRSLLAEMVALKPVTLGVPGV